MDSAPVQDDFHWMEGCKRGEKAAQKALFQSLVTYLRGVVRRYIWDAEVVEDVLQEAFIRIFRNVGRYDAEKGTVKTWAARIAVNVALTEGKKRVTPHWIWPVINCPSHRGASGAPSVTRRVLNR